MVLVCAVAIEGELDFFNPVVFGRLSSQNKFSVHKSPAAVVQEERINCVAKWISHPGGHEYIFVTVRVEVGNADAPRPEGLRADFVRHFGELAMARVPVKRIPENAVGSGSQGIGRPFDGTPLLAFLLGEGGAEILFGRFDLEAR